MTKVFKTIYRSISTLSERLRSKPQRPGTLEEMLRTMLDEVSLVTGNPIKMSPDFIVSIRHLRSDGVHFGIRAEGLDMDELEFLAIDDEIWRL